MGRVVADLTPLRRHRSFRRLWLGQLVSSMGSQLTVVAVSFQAYRLTHSTLIVGLVSVAQLVPLLVGSQIGGTLADARDRRRVMISCQILAACSSGGLLANALLPRPTLWPLFACTAVSAALQAVDQPSRRAALPMLVPPEDLTAAVALQTILLQVALVVGPALAGLLIATAGLGLVYGIDAGSFAAALVAVLLLPRLVPTGGGTPAGLRSLAEGFRYVRSQRLLSASFLIDIDAMVFGMPRAVFPALGTGLFGGGAGVVGLLYAAPGAGALVGSLLTGWVSRIRHQGRAVVISVVAWGAAITVFGVVPILGVGLALLALAGAADVVSAVFRQAILQHTAPDHMQGRMSGVFFGVVAGGPRLGDAETGAAAALGGPQFAVWSGGVACLVGVGLLVWRIPELWKTISGPDPLDEVLRHEAVAEAATELDGIEPI